MTTDYPEIEEAEDVDGESIPVSECELYGVEEAWRPSTEAEFDRILRKINAARDEAKRMRDNAARLLTQAKAVEGRGDWYENRYLPEIEAFARERIAGQRDQTVVLSHGQIALRREKAKVRIDADTAEVVAWAKANAPELVATKTTESVNQTELKKRLTIKMAYDIDANTGEATEMALVVDSEGMIVPIASVVPAAERFSVK